MKPLAVALSFVVLGSSLALPAAADPPAERNPFARPPARAEGGEAPAASPALRLRATMTAGRDSLANIDGRIIRIGETFGGYRLVAVGEGTAVVVKDGVPHLLSLEQQEAAP